MSTAASETARQKDASEEIAQLRRQVEQLIGERGAALAEQAAATARSEVEALAEHVRSRPIAAVVIALGLGVLLGRALSR